MNEFITPQMQSSEDRLNYWLQMRLLMQDPYLKKELEKKHQEENPRYAHSVPPSYFDQLLPQPNLGFNGAGNSVTPDIGIGGRGVKPANSGFAMPEFGGLMQEMPSDEQIARLSGRASDRFNPLGFLEGSDTNNIPRAPGAGTPTAVPAQPIPMNIQSLWNYIQAMQRNSRA